MLRETIEHLGGEVFPGGAASSDICLLLPSAGAEPLASPQLLRDEATMDEPAGLAPWTVPAWSLNPAEALDSLLAVDSLPAEAAELREIALSDSVRFWIEVAKLAVEQVARGRFVPTLEVDDSAWMARWRPMPTDPVDAGRAALLAEAMPAICRAELSAEDLCGRGAAPGGGWDAFTGRSPRAILDSALDALVDAATRESLGGESLLPPRRGRPPRRLPAGEAWLEALTAADPWVDAGPDELASLQRDLDLWLATTAPDPSDTALRTCFRLTPPPDDAPANGSSAWRLDFLLQATDDPSLLVDADRVWKARGGALRVLRRRLDEPQEKLLEDLGRAWRLFPGLEPALRTARPVGLDLDTEGAHHFLAEAAPLLEGAGFGVLVPPWWKKDAARLGLRLVASPRVDGGSGTGLLGLEGICAYQWQVALGDEALGADEFRALARLKVPLVRFRGQWVELRPEQIEAALRLFEEGRGAGEMTVAEVLRIGLGADAVSTGLPVTGLEAQGWLAELLASVERGDSRLRTTKMPKSFRGKLRPYQRRGLAWLAFLDRSGLGACLADDMGLGKTAQTLALLALEREGRGDGALLTPTLLICPMSVVGNWQREAARFTPTLRVHVHHGGERASGGAFREAVASSDLVVTTYALAARDRDELAAIDWGRVVLDEAQNIKNPDTRQTIAIRSLPAARRLALTGTPVENRLLELWSILDFLNPGLLGSASDFRRRFATPIERYRDEERAALLKRLTGPFILRRLKTDSGIIRDLPEKLEIKVFCNLTREQASLYQATVDDMLEQIEESEGIKRKGLVLSTMMKLKQICNHPAQLLQDGSRVDGRSGKLARLEEVLDEALAVGDRALVFTQFAEMGHLLRAHLQARLGREVLFLHGGTQKKARDAMVARFQSEVGPPVFLLSLKAGGTGLNLTAANHVIHFDRWWNPAVEDQATDRAFRIGQSRNVQVRKFVCTGTLEERIDQMIEQKKDLAERIVGTGEAWLTELSTAELRALVALSADAVAE